MRSVAEFIDKYLGLERYCFTWPELKLAVPKSDIALRHEIQRLSAKNEVTVLRRGFYLIMPHRYRSYKRLPPELYLEKLFKYLDKPYYIALYSASAMHGASHQAIQKSYLMTSPPNFRTIKKDNNYLKIYTTKKWPEKNIQQRKSNAGYFYLSSPALTAIDLIHYQAKIGGTNSILANLEELLESVTVQDVKDLLSWYPHGSTLQRLGYLFQEVGADDTLLAPLEHYLHRRKFFPVLLFPEKVSKAGKALNRWKIDLNLELDSDL